MEPISQFKKLMDEYILLFDHLIDFESKKLDAIAANDVDCLELIMRDEQAYLLKLKGLDLKREKLQEQMNMKNLTFSEILTRLDGEIKDVLEKSFETLSKRTEEMKAATNSTKLYIELHLHSLNLLISKLGGESQVKALYDKSGTHSISNVSHFESKKV